ncbi:thymidylate kinase [Aliidongia dinghuensis]|uniref:Thymidylate kinase n=1 Tax=Aliidongia dinghuensis TaxID=1867774 RepID=A0A8J2YS47_9PROT|nr:dTMP kinase [Aliidongia dinghuensis]GGF14459.1 thymidylate kinase [Aliidongia dinghuensis]
MPHGRFVTLEGGEGAGKSTQIKRLAERLRAAGFGVVETREPGGAPGAEEIRNLLLGGGVERWDSVTEALLMYAARRDHLVRTVWPALDQGQWVLCDRFEDSTRAYQGAGSGLDRAVIDALGKVARGPFAPDMTLILDLPVAVGRARAAARRGANDRFEQRDDAFHERVRQGFLAIAAAEPKRCAVIDASRPLDEVAAAITQEVERRLGVALP